MRDLDSTVMEPNAGTPMLGRLLDDRYRLDSVIARGGMATVYLATDTRLDRAVAVKVMHRALAEDPEFVARFTREAKASARISAPEVVAVHDQGTDADTRLAYLVMEHVRGINLRQLLQERGALPPARAVSLMEPVLRALAAAHAAGLVHRDIKPENVLLADDGRVKVADFGLARAVETSTLTQTTGLLIGTVAYLAPEQVESGTADARTDVYAAGVLLWELLTGAPPYGGDSPLSVAYKHVNEDVPPPSSAVPGIPPELDALVVRATRRDPDARPLDGGAFLADLVALQDDLPPVAASAPLHSTLVVPRVPPPTAAAPKETKQPKAPKPPKPPRRRRRGLVAVALLVVLALLALGGGYYLGSYRYTTAPRVLDLTLAQAESKLKTVGLKAKEGPDEFSETIATGHVLKQTPAGNGRVRKGGTVTLFLSKGKDRRRVPQLAGESVAIATQKLRNQGLAAAPQPVLEYSETVTKDTILRTDPAAGAGLKPGSVVTLVVSRGPAPVKVPSVVGKDQADAEQILAGAGFQVDSNDVFSDTVPKGKVVSQSPATGTAPRGSTVTLAVSKGPDLVTVPKVVDKKLAEGQQILQAAGFKVSVRRFANGPGKILDQRPGAGAQAKRGSTVTVYVF